MLVSGEKFSEIFIKEAVQKISESVIASVAKRSIPFLSSVAHTGLLRYTCNDDPKDFLDSLFTN
jgi:hypothetical protein